MTNYIHRHRRILKHLGIWDKCTEAEKIRFKSCTTEIQVDNMMVAFRHKYL